jgi:acyl-CoA thioester hydrolase
MWHHETKYRVLYADTDTMGVVYYANYLKLYELGRNELMRSKGVPFSLLEHNGIVCPAVDVRLRYLKPAIFDEEILIVTKIKEIPAVRFSFVQEIQNLNKEVINIAEIDLCFVSLTLNKPQRCPEFLLNFFKEV